MIIKRRDMMLSNFPVKGEKKYFSKEITIGEKKGVVSIIKWFNVEERFEVHYNFKDEIIVDNNYTWVQIALENENFWIKVMFDEKNDLIEIYIDVAKAIFFDNPLNPEFEDLFVDIIVPSKGHIYSMDENELMKAKVDGTISDEEYNMAKIVAKKLISFLNDNHQEFLDYVNRLKQELEYELFNN